MKIERKTLAALAVGELAVDVETVTYRVKSDTPILAAELSFRLGGATVASSYTFSPDGEQWRDAMGVEVDHDYMSARGLGKFQRHVVEAVARTWALAENLSDDPRTIRARAQHQYEINKVAREAEEARQAKKAQDSLYEKAPASDADLARGAV